MPKVVHNKGLKNQKYAGTSVTDWNCPRCDYSESVNNWTRNNLHCPKCSQVGNHTVLRKAKVIEAHKADEIRSRQVIRDVDEPIDDPNPFDAWDEGIVPHNKRTRIKAVGSGPELKVQINRNRACYENKVVYINGTPYRLNDLGFALQGAL